MIFWAGSVIGVGCEMFVASDADGDLLRRAYGADRVNPIRHLGHGTMLLGNGGDHQTGLGHPPG